MNPAGHSICGKAATKLLRKVLKSSPWACHIFNCLQSGICYAAGECSGDCSNHVSFCRRNIVPEQGTKRLPKSGARQSNEYALRRTKGLLGYLRSTGACKRCSAATPYSHVCFRRFVSLKNPCARIGTGKRDVRLAGLYIQTNRDLAASLANPRVSQLRLNDQ